MHLMMTCSIAAVAVVLLAACGVINAPIPPKDHVTAQAVITAKIADKIVLHTTPTILQEQG